MHFLCYYHYILVKLGNEKLRIKNSNKHCDLRLPKLYINYVKCVTLGKRPSSFLKNCCELTKGRESFCSTDKGNRFLHFRHQPVELSDH